MKRRFITQDGERFEADTELALVKQMMKGAWDVADTVEDYMRSVATRTEQQNNTKIDASSAHAFVTSLLKAGLLEEIKEGED